VAKAHDSLIGPFLYRPMSSESSPQMCNNIQYKDVSVCLYSFSFRIHIYMYAYAYIYQQSFLTDFRRCNQPNHENHMPQTTLASLNETIYPHETVKCRSHPVRFFTTLLYLALLLLVASDLFARSFSDKGRMLMLHLNTFSGSYTVLTSRSLVRFSPNDATAVPLS